MAKDGGKVWQKGNGENGGKGRKEDEDDEDRQDKSDRKMSSVQCGRFGS